MADPPTDDEPLNPFIAAFLAAGARGEPSIGDRLPAHTPGCYGCGPDNPHSMGLAVTVGAGSAVEAEYVFADRFVGAPGVAHGGAVSAVIDDLFGYVLMRVRRAAVTRELSVRYRLPVRLGLETRLTACLDHEAGRELHLSAQVRQEGHLVATGRAVFIEVDPQHLAAPASRFFG